MKYCRKVPDVIRSFVIVRSLQLEYVRVIHEDLIVPVLMYLNETGRSGEGKI